MTSPAFPSIVDTTELWLMFRTVASESFFAELQPASGPGSRSGIFSIAMVIWLMLYQRLHSKGTLVAALQVMTRLGQSGHLRLAHPCKRIREGNISANTGGYCQARQKLPMPVVKTVSNHIFDQLRQQLRDPSHSGPPVYVIDGTTLRLRHERDLVEAFPPGHNQHGGNHWPVLLMVAFHDVYTGLAAQPSWGAMYGPKAVSEQSLAEQALDRLPADAIVLADGNFGIFAFVHAVQKSQRPILARLTASRARKILGNTTPSPGKRRKVTWLPSIYERRAHPDLPPEASVEGWVVVSQNPARPTEMLYLFTTLDWTPARILELYKLRWNIETDLRSLKRTIGLHQINGRAKAMVEKELLLAVSAYNLVRAVIAIAACREGLPARQFSFSVSQDAVMAAWSDLQQATTTDDYNREMELLLFFVSKAKLPKRSGSRSYPREIWGRGGHFPFRRSIPATESGQ